MAAKRRLGAIPVLPHDMIQEILTWLPTKSLMRFKLVSKRWLSSIVDPNFARAHRVPFRGLLVMNPDPSIHPVDRQPTENFFLANFDGGEVESNNIGEVSFSFQFSVPDDVDGFEISNVVNGIVCFYHCNVSKLFNIATREIISLPKSKHTYRDRDWEWEWECDYHLGFDPIQNVYKLVKISAKLRIRGKTKKMVGLDSEILTIGVDSSWRSIDTPPDFITPHGLSVDGVLYWMVKPFMQQKEDSFGRVRHTLYSFDLASEKFQSIQRPGFNPKLVEFGTSLALTGCSMFCPSSSRSLISATYYRQGSWSEFYKYNPIHTVDEVLPVSVRGLLPNGNLIIYNSMGISIGGPIYMYDPKRNYLLRFIAKFPDCPFDGIGGRICWYEDNIISLKHL